METIDKSVLNFVMSCYILSGLTFIGSFIFILQSKQHHLTITLLLIYILEIICQTANVITFQLNNAARVNEFLTACAYSCHWIALGLFTGEYIKVSTQIPLLRDIPKFSWFPLLLNLIILGTLAVTIYGVIFVQGVSTLTAWIVFLAKTFLANSILIVQIVSIRSIRKMIENGLDLVIN